MKKYALMLAGVAFLIGNPLFADDMKGMKMDKADMKMDKTEMKHDTTMCAKHCNIMELEKQVNALKGQAASADKAATKEHLKKDIETYEKKLKEMETELEGK